MRRSPRIYEPEERRYTENNLQCHWCGNTTGFSIDLRLKQGVEVVGEGLIVELSQNRRDRLERSLSSNILQIISKAQDSGKEILKCTNCGDGEGVDLQERIIDFCWQTGCPGCWHCGLYIDEEEVRFLCSECIREKEGAIDENDCQMVCPHYDFGLGQVRDHYNMRLEDLKEEQGY